MKLFSSFILMSVLALAVSCGGKDKSSSSSDLRYQVDQFGQPVLSTVEAYYNPSQMRQMQIYYSGNWYTLAPQQQNSQMSLQSVYQSTYQALISGSNQYTLTVVNNIPVFRVRVTGYLGAGYNQYPQQNTGSGVFTFQSIQLY